MARDKRANQVYRTIRKTKAAKTTLEHKKKTYPSIRDGVSGNIQVRETPNGLELLCQSSTGQWYSTPLRKLKDTLRVADDLDVEGIINTNKGFSIKNEKVTADAKEINKLTDQFDVADSKILPVRVGTDNIPTAGNINTTSEAQSILNAEAMNDNIPTANKDFYLDESYSPYHYLWYKTSDTVAYRATFARKSFAQTQDPEPEDPNPDCTSLSIVEDTSGNSHSEEYLVGTNFNDSGGDSDSLYVKAFFNTETEGWTLPLTGSSGVCQAIIARIQANGTATDKGTLNIDTSSITSGSTAYSTGLAIDTDSGYAIGDRFRATFVPNNTRGGGYELDETPTCEAPFTLKGIIIWGVCAATNLAPTVAEVKAGMTAAYGTYATGAAEANYGNATTSGSAFGGWKFGTNNSTSMQNYLSAFNGTSTKNLTTTTARPAVFIAYSNTTTLTQIMMNDGNNFIGGFTTGLLTSGDIWTNPAGFDMAMRYYIMTYNQDDGQLWTIDSIND